MSGYWWMTADSSKTYFNVKIMCEEGVLILHVFRRVVVYGFDNYDDKMSCMYDLFTGIYSCPCYYYPNRAGGSGRASFIVAVDLKAGDMSSDHWTKRGTALLMSLDTQTWYRSRPTLLMILLQTKNIRSKLVNFTLLVNPELTN